MIRKQIYIESRQDTTLKQQAKALGITEAEVIRRAIDRQMALVRLNVRDLKAWEREKTFIAKRMAKGRAPGGRLWKREDAYEERLMRYGR
jgi:3-mercaptopyruvate sulfurtransferase SseA